MSTRALRDQIKSFIAANSAETVVDISGEFRELTDVATANGITISDDWVAIQFIGSEIEPISIVNDCYREFGSVFVHVIAPIQLDVVNGNILDRADTLINLFRNQKRINDIVIESTSVLNTEGGTTLEFDNGFTSGTFFINYYRDIKGA